jgi:heme iron utilization protein
MSWVSADDHAAAEPDPLRPHVAGIVEHMNDDHAAALVAYCRVFGGRAATERAEMVGVDRYGFTMLAHDDGAAERTAVRIPFGRPVDTPGAVRTAMIELLHEARAASGS